VSVGRRRGGRSIALGVQYNRPVHGFAPLNPEDMSATPRVERKVSLLSVCAITFGILVVVAMANRSRYGATYTDEPFYIAMPYRFGLGDRPFVDEYNFLQTFGLLLYPIVDLYTHITHGTTGIVLFMRGCYLSLMLVTGASIFSYTRRKIRWELALVVSLLPLLFAPWGIQALSYNTMGGAFLTIGLFMTLRFCGSGARTPLILAGVANGLCMVAYPPMVIPVALEIVFLLRLTNTWRSRAGLWQMVGAGLVLVPFVVYLVTIGISQILSSYKFTQSQHAYVGSLVQIFDMVRDLTRTAVLDPFLVLIVVILAVRRLWPASSFASGWLSGIAAMMAPFAVIPILTFREFNTLPRSNGAFVCLAFIGVATWLFRRDVVGSGEAHLVVLPSFVAGFVTAFTSTNGYLNASIGLLPAGAMTLLWLCRMAEEGFSRNKLLLKHASYCALLSVAGVVTVMLVMQYRVFYFQPGGMATLTQTISTGPFAGINSTPQAADLIVNMQQDVLRLSRPGDRILFFNSFPAGYLLTNLRPATDTVWTLPPNFHSGVNVDTNAVIEYFSKNHVYPSIVVQVVGGLYEPSDPLVRLVLSNQYRRVLNNDQYAIYRRVARG
jgi:hypothetical protein